MTARKTLFTVKQVAAVLPVHFNKDYDWNRFGAQKYFEHNYEKMREDDAEMLAVVRDWFAESAGDALRSGVDVGAGSNLYPALALLRHCRKITLCDYSKTNVAWLRRTIARLPDSWSQFWDLLAPDAGEPGFAAASELMRKRCKVKRRSIFKLRARHWEMGTMFFVAESLSEDHGEFERALGAFFGALKPGAPFAAAFMERSVGYEVDETPYPAVAIDADQLEASIGVFEQVELKRVARVDINPSPVRPGYTGYLVALGRIRD